MLTRREFIPLTAAGVLGARESAEMISQQSEFYHGWPTLVRLRSGGLIVAYSGSRETHVCPFGRVEIIRSPDEGRTWSWPEVILDTPIDDRDAGVLETPTGTLLVTTFTSLAYEPVLARAKGWPTKRLERWRAVDRRTSESQRRGLLGTWMLRSTDGGMTWSAPYRVPLNSPHGPIAVSGGRLLYAGKQLWSPGTKVGVAESSDDGKPGAGLRTFRRGLGIALKTTMNCIRSRPQTDESSFKSGITIRPTRGRRCSVNRGMAVRRGQRRIRSECGACRPICCDCTTETS